MPTARGFLRMLLAWAAGLVGLLLALPVVLLTLPFHLVSAATRWLADRLEPGYLAWNEVFAFDREFGWRPKPNLDTHHLADDVYQITTDGDGWRGSLRVEDARFVVLGDSFAWGHGIDDRHFFAALRPELRIKALGSNGYSMVQELLWLRRLAPVLGGKLVVWLVYYGNDLHDNLAPHMFGYRRPFVREAPGEDGWSLVRSHVTPEPWPFVTRLGAGSATNQRATLAEACAPGFQAGRIYSACEYLIREGRGLCEEAGATLVIAGIPDPLLLQPHGGRALAAELGATEPLDVTYPDRRLGEICGKLGVRFLPLRERLTVADYKETDCHWNERGHARIAAILADLHAEYPASDSEGGRRGGDRPALALGGGGR